jgi:hypothetical protein
MRVDNEEDQPDYTRPLREWLADPEWREELRRADIVVSIDVHDPNHSSCFFGRRTLDRIAQTGKTKEETILQVPIDYDTDDVEILVAVCLEYKGSCCYNGEARINPDHN